PPRPRARAPACCRTTARRGERVRRESMLPTLLCCDGLSGKVTTHMLTAALDYKPADPGLLVTACDPFGDKNRLRLAFSLDGDVPRHLHAPVDVLDGCEPEARTHARAGRNGAGEAHAVQAVVDPQTRALNLDRLPQQERQKREREKTVCDGHSV